MDLKNISSATIQITNRKLNGSNYIQWSKSVKVFLGGLGKQNHLTTDPPTEQEKSESWLQADYQIMGALWNSMEPQIADLCTHFDSSKQIWEHLQILYTSNVSRMYDLSTKYHHCQMEGKDFTTHYGNFNRICEELNSVLPISSDIHTMRKQRDQMNVLRFLSSLPAEYEALKTQVLAGAELPTLTEVYSRGLRFSHNISSDGMQMSDKSALASQFSVGGHGGQSGRGISWSGDRGAQSGRGISWSHDRGARNGGRGGRSSRGSRGRGESRKSRSCDHCGLKNHTRSTCWDLIGRPPRVANVASSEPIETHVPAIPKTVTIPEDEYSKFLQYQAAQQASLPTASLARLGFGDEEDDWRRA